MALRQFLQTQYGIRTDIIESVVTLGTTPVPIVGNNPNRISYTISNLSNLSIYTSGNPSVSATTGFQITPAGFQSFDWRVDADTAGYQLNGISTGTALVYVREVVIIPDEIVA